MTVSIPHRKLEIWADYLLDHSMGGIQPADVVMVKGEPITWPLMSILQDKIFAAGAIADICLVPPDNFRGRVWGASIARHGTVDQIQRVPHWHHSRYEAMNKYIEILGSERPELVANLPEKTGQALARADEPFKNIRLAKNWVLTLYPTQAFADIEGMSLAQYTDIIVSASTVDPKLLEKAEEPIYELLERGRSVRVVTRHPGDDRSLELTMDIAGRYAVKCTGIRNFPDGEVYTSPDANSVQGEIFVDLPVFYDGVTIRGIYLKFSGGVITQYHAEEGFDTLRNIIETDAGSHRLGEVALGMNNGIQTALKHPLFVEKVGGTFHIAIGSSYPECYVREPNSESGQREIQKLIAAGVCNKSAQHVDIVADFRPGGCGQAIFIDDRQLVLRDNLWIVP